MKQIVKTFDELTLDELYEILKLRVDVFVVEQECPYPEIDGIDRACIHVFLTENGQIAAYARVVPQGVKFDKASVGRITSRKRGCGVGAEILLLAVKTAVDRFKAESVIAEAQTYARGFYEKAGFVKISDEFMDDGIEHILMEKQCV